MKRILLLLLLALAPQVAHAQVVAQGAPATTTDARAWPIKVVFGGAQIDPRIQGTAAAVTAGWPINNGASAISTATWTSATPNLTTQTVTVTGYSSVTVQLQAPATVTNGNVAFQMTVDGTNWVGVSLRDVSMTSPPNSSFPMNGGILFQGFVHNEVLVGNITGATQFRLFYDNSIFPFAGAGTLSTAIGLSTMPANSPQWSQVIGRRSNNSSTAVSAEFLGVLPAIANTAVPSYTDGRPVVLSTDLNGVARIGGPVASGSAKVGSPIMLGGVFTTVQPTVTTGQIVDLQTTNRGGLIIANGVDAFTASVTQAVAANLNATVVGTVTANAGTNLNTSLLSLETTQTSVKTAVETIDNIVSGAGANISQFGGTNVVTGTGVGGAGIPRVTVSSDSTVTANAGTNLNTSALSLEATQASVKTAVEIIDNIVSGAGANISQFGGTNVVTGTGAGGAGIPRVTVSNDSVITANPTAVSIMSISSNESVVAPTADTWYIRRQWALPASAHFTPTRAWAAVTTAASRTMVVVINNLGNLNLSTNTYTAANSVASPFFYGRLFGCVTTVMSATLDTITPTYTDELGNSQAATGTAFAASSPVGNCFEFPLAASSGAALDSGVRAVTAAVDTAAPTGVVTFYGVNVLLDTVGPAATLDSTTIDLAGELNANEQIAIMLRQAATTAQQRSAGVSGSLR